MVPGLILSLLATLPSFAIDTKECERQIRILSEQLETTGNPSLYEALANEVARLKTELGGFPELLAPSLLQPAGQAEKTTTDADVERFQADTSELQTITDAANALALMSTLEPGLSFSYWFATFHVREPETYPLSLFRSLLFVRDNPQKFPGAKVDFGFPIAGPSRGLIHALFNSKYELAELLLDAGAPVRGIVIVDHGGGDIEKLTIFHFAIKDNVPPALVSRIISRGADVKAPPNGYQPNALFRLWVDHPLELYTAIIDAGVDLNAKDLESKTALERMALKYSNTPSEKALSIIELLIDAGADPTIQDRNGRSAEQILVKTLNQNDAHQKRVLEKIRAQARQPSLWQRVRGAAETKPR